MPEFAATMPSNPLVAGTVDIFPLSLQRKSPSWSLWNFDALRDLEGPHCSRCSETPNPFLYCILRTIATSIPGLFDISRCDIPSIRKKRAPAETGAQKDLKEVRTKASWRTGIAAKNPHRRWDYGLRESRRR